MSRDDRLSAARRGYDYKWRTVIQPAQLAREPLCRFCKENRRVTAATVVDHIDGDSWNRKTENLRSLCKPCHDSRTALDQGFARSASFYPKSLPRVRLPTTIVCGPPGAGQLQWIEKQKGPADVIVDLDLVSLAIHGKPLIAVRSDAIPRVVIARNDLIKSLAAREHGAVWFVETGAELWKRRHWRNVFDVVETVVLETPSEGCTRGVVAPGVQTGHGDTIRAAGAWWERYTVDYTDRRIA